MLADALGRPLRFKRLQANSIQPHFMLAHMAQFETVERLIRRGVYKGPLILNVGIGGGASGTHPADLLELVRRTPDGTVLTIEGIMRSVIPMNMIMVVHTEYALAKGSVKQNIAPRWRCSAQMLPP
jgi:uncharacterized protein (DUF849 family)